MKATVGKSINTTNAPATQATSAFDTQRNQTFDGIQGPNDSLFQQSVFSAGFQGGTNSIENGNS